MKNMPRIIRCGLLLGLAGLLAFAGAGCNKFKKSYHLNRANRFYAAGDLPQAEIEYLNTLRSDPLNRLVIGRLGLIYFEEGRVSRAAVFLAKGSELATNDLELRLKLGLIYSAAGRTKEATDAANFILNRKPQDDEAPLLLAEAAVKPKEIAAARQQLQTLARGGDRAALEVALGNLAFHEHDLAGAEAAFKRAQTLDAKSATVSAALGALAWARNDLKAAETFFKAAADASPVRSPRRMQYARFKIQTGDRAGARQVLDEIIKPAPDYAPALLVLAEIAASEKKYDECAGLLADVLGRDPDSYDALLLEARVKLAQGSVDQAVTGLEHMAKLYPLAPAVQFQLAQAYWAANDATKAVSTLNRVLDINPNVTEAILLLAQIQIKSGNADPVIVSLEQLRRKQPEQVQAQLLLADAYRLRNRIGEALAIYEPLEKSFPRHPEIPLLAGSAYLQLQDSAKAQQEFERVLAIAPENLPALEQLVNLDLLATNFESAMRRVSARLAQTPKQMELHLLTAKIQLAAGNRAQAEATLLKAQELDPQNQGPYLLLAQLYVDSQQNQKALVKLDAAIAKDPKDISALMLMAFIHNAEKEYAQAAATYEKLLVLDPKFSPALNNLAYLDSEYLNNLDRAYELAQRARELLPFDPSTADTLGWITFKRGSYPAALGLLKESAAKLATDPEVQFHLGMASYMTADEAAARMAFQIALQNGANFPGRADCQRCLAILNLNPDTDPAAPAALEKRIAEKPDDPIALARLAVLYQRQGQIEKAVATSETILQVTPKNLEAMIRLVRLYPAKDLKKAYETAKAAYKLAPYNPEVARLLGRTAYLSGDFKLAASLLQQTAKSQPDNAPLLFDYAQAAFSVGNLAESQTALQNALQLKLATPQAAEAQRQLQLIGLAVVPAQAVAAAPQLAEILKAEPDYVPALFASAVGNEAKGNPAAAAAADEKILERYPDFAPAQKQLAGILATDATKTGQAYALAMKAREALPADPALAKTLGIILIQRGDFNRAVNVLKESQTQLGADPEIYFYLGTAQYQLKNRTESQALLKKALTLNLSGKLAETARQMLGEK